jgi:hypothetical protein
MEVTDRGYSRRSQLASNFYFGHDNSTRFLIIRRHGWEKARDIETFFLKKHQETHFIDGATKLGVIDHPHHVLCAEYHCLSNWLGGLDMGYVPDRGDGKAWVCYFPPEASTGAPFLPSPASWMVPMEMMISIFTWHARNGKLLGNDRLYFCLTDHVMGGGPFNMGYFAEADHALKPEERLRLEFGTSDVEPGPPPELATGAWPLARREAALEKYNAEYMLGGFAQTATVLGEEETIQIAERSHFANVVQWCRPLAVELGMTGDTAAARFADLFAKTWGLVGDKFTVHTEGGDIFLENTKTRLYTPQYPGWEYAPRALEEAFAKAWTVSSRAVGAPVEVTVAESRMDGAENTVWRFRETAHSAYVGAPGEYDLAAATGRELMIRYWD